MPELETYLDLCGPVGLSHELGRYQGTAMRGLLPESGDGKREGLGMFPMRLSIVTYNLWNTERWSLRAPALRQFVEIFRPDILCLQELRAETQAVLDTVMPQLNR